MKFSEWYSQTLSSRDSTKLNLRFSDIEVDLTPDKNDSIYVELGNCVRCYKLLGVTDMSLRRHMNLLEDQWIRAEHYKMSYEAEVVKSEVSDSLFQHTQSLYTDTAFDLDVQKKKSKILGGTTGGLFLMLLGVVIFK